MNTREEIIDNQIATINLAKAAMFTALAVGAGYALLLVPNVELITAVVFISGVYLGPVWGMIVGAFSEFVFSSLNPLGSGLIFLPLLIAQVVGISLVGLSGGLLRHLFLTDNWTLVRMVLIGAVGGVLTFIYDTLTTLSYPLAAGFEWRQTVALYITGIGFTALHQISNVIIFFTALPRVFSRIDSNRYK